MLLKLKKFNDATVVYTNTTYYVCETMQEMPKQDDVFITLKLKSKKRGEKNVKN